MMVATIPHCFFVAYYPSKQLHRLQNSRKSWLILRLKRSPPPNTNTNIKQQIRLISLQLPLQSSPIISNAYAAVDCCFRCHCTAIFNHSKSAIIVLLLIAPNPKSIPSSIPPIPSGNLLLVDCCITPTCCCMKSPPTRPIGSRCNRAIT
jgi:hypothetical protein